MEHEPVVFHCHRSIYLRLDILEIHGISRLRGQVLQILPPRGLELTLTSSYVFL